MGDTDELLTGRAAEEAAQGYAPPPEAPKPENETYASDQDGLQKAARDLAESRQPDAPPEITRAYQQQGGSHDGERSPENQTIKIARAAHDLTQQRDVETTEKQDQEAANLAQELDEAKLAIAAARAEAATLGPNSEIDFTQPQPDAAPPERPANGLDPDVAQALQNPKVRAALETEVRGAEMARQAYVGATTQAAEMAGAALFATFPELNGLNTQQLPIAIDLIGRQNPGRRAEILAHVDRVRTLWGAKNQAQAAENQIAQQRFNMYVSNEDVAFERSISSDGPEKIKAVKDAVVNIARDEYGIQPEELGHLWNTQPLMRTAAMQRMMYDAAQYQLARRGVKKAPASIQTVQRPGVANHSYRDDAVDTARNSFSRNPTPKTAAAFLRARRAAE